MNGRFDIRSYKGSSVNQWIIASACLIFIVALCIPGFSTIGKEAQIDKDRIDIEHPIDPGMLELIPDFEVSGIVKKISVDVRVGKYECLVLLNIMRMGIGVDIDYILYVTDRELQSIFELAYAEGKSLRAWGREVPHEMEIDGEAHLTFRITRVQI